MRRGEAAPSPSRAPDTEPSGAAAEDVTESVAPDVEVEPSAPVRIIVRPFEVQGKTYGLGEESAMEADVSPQMQDSLLALGYLHVPRVPQRATE